MMAPAARMKFSGDNHRDWRPGGILGGTGFPARAEYDSISEACTICSRVLVSTNASIRP